MKLSRLPFLLLSSCVFLPAYVAAIPDAPVRIRFRACSGEEALPNVFLWENKELLPVPLLPYSPSDPVEMEVDSLDLDFVSVSRESLQILRNLDDAIVAAATEEDRSALENQRREFIETVEKTPLVRVRLNANDTDVLLAFLPTGLREPGNYLKVNVISNHARTFPEESFRLVNWSPFEVGYLFGGKSGILTPGQVLITEPELDSKRRSRIELAARRRDNGEWLLFHEAPVSLRPGHRTTLVFAFTSSYLDIIGSEGVRGADGKLPPEMIVIPWTERPLP